MGVLGTAEKQQRTHPPKRADELATITIPDQEGHDVTLGDLWRERPVALVWLRHYG